MMELAKARATSEYQLVHLAETMRLEHAKKKQKPARQETPMPEPRQTLAWQAYLHAGR